MAKSFALLIVDPQMKDDVLLWLWDIPEQIEVHLSPGPYDMIVEFDVPLGDVPRVVNLIRSINGIESTTTLVGYPDNINSQPP